MWMARPQFVQVLFNVLFYAANTGKVSGVMALVQCQPLREVWRNSLLWSFPYYKMMSALASLLATIAGQSNWYFAMLALPLLYLLYEFYRELVDRLPQRQTPVKEGLRLVA